MERGVVRGMGHARHWWWGWFLGLRTELHCNHNYKEEGGERSLNKCEYRDSSKKEIFDSPTDLRILSHFTSSISDLRSYKVTRDLFSMAYKREHMEHCYGRREPAYSRGAPRSQGRPFCLHPSLHSFDCRHPFGPCMIPR